MKAIQLISHGKPQTTCKCVNMSDLPAPTGKQILVSIKASAINPADLLIFQGRYPGPETLPAAVGIEGAGIVEMIGDEVTEFSVGDHVLSLGRSNWAEQVCDDEDRFIPIAKSLSWQQAAQLKANPPSAHLMLNDYVDLVPGDWVIQNAANSAVGRHVISFCKARGLRSVNIVRREALVDELTQAGADIVLVDSDDLARQVRILCGEGANIRLGIDAIGGEATSKMADCLSDDSTVVNYGFLSGKPCQFTPYHTIIHNLTLKGFWLVGFMKRSTRQEVIDMYQLMAAAFINGDIDVPIEAEYPLDRITDAIAHAAMEHRNGKVILRPDLPSVH